MLAEDLEEGHRYQAPAAGNERVAGFVPIRIVFPSDHVEEVALAEGELVQVSGIGLVVVEGFDDLRGVVRTGVSSWLDRGRQDSGSRREGGRQRGCSNETKVGTRG